MSGIAGIYNLDGRPVDPALLMRMTDVISHRGADGAGHWIDGPVGLGHRMLHTTPESLYEAQPLINETGQLVMIADARIDNRDELIATLAVNTKPKEQITDAELILKAYQKWGGNCPEKLQGDFAFVIWDNSNQRVFCARDPIGIKPFYYYVGESRFLCASEPSQFFQYPSISKEANLALIGRYLLNDFSEREETLYKQINRLPPAHCLTCGKGGIRKIQYWDIDPSNEIRYKKDEEYAEHFLDLFQQSVKACLRSNGPVGAWLSGGLDSSSIVCTAQKLYREGVVKDKGFETFSIVFDELSCDEKPYIEAVINKWKLTAHSFVYEENADSVDIDRVRCYPDILYDPTLFMTEPPLRRARERGIKIILSGIGGDDLLAAGFYHLADLLRRFRISDLVAQIKADATTYEKRPIDLFLYSALLPLIPRRVKTVLRGVSKPFRGDGVPPWINQDFVKKFNLKSRLRNRSPNQKFPTFSQGQIYNYLRSEWNTNIALSVNELFASRFSLEVRYPFFDRRLVEYLLAIPEEQRWWNDQPKTVLRNAMRDILPEAIRKRNTKADFGSLQDIELKMRQNEKATKIINSLALTAVGVVDDKSIQHMFAGYCRGNSKPWAALSVILSLELWYRAEFG